MTENEEIIKEFLAESNENLDQLDRDLVELEKNPASREILGSIFRTIHTIKGTTGFLGFSKLESVAHAGESLLSRLRDGKLSLTPQLTNSLLAMGDAVREMLAAIEATGRDGGQDYAALIGALQRLQGVQQAPGRYAEEEGATEAGQEEGAEPETPSGPLLFGQILSESGQVNDREIQAALEAQQAGDPRRLGEILVERGAISPLAVREAIEKQKRQQAIAANTIRVDVRLLDELMNLVGELVLARNQIVQLSAARQDATLIGASQRLSTITTGLQQGVMKTRMQSIDKLWSTLPRMVRDLALSCGKKVRVEMKGRETELDKTIIEAIKDPITHAVRNAVDHGIEPPEQRIAAGKSAEGLLSLRAFREGGQVKIEISDDGAGISLDRVKQEAVDRGLVTSEEAASMREHEAMNLIFLPGFSTAAKITSVSGRGVGLDVVRTNIEKIGGAVDMRSQAGQGSTLKMNFPLTLAIIPALIVTCRGDRFAIPQASFLELVSLEGDEAHQRIEPVHGAPVYRLRGNLLPLVYLDRELNLPAARSRANGNQDVVNIVVLQVDERQFGLVVDEVSDTQETVVKPLGKRLKGLPVYAGATILGDGRVALILDVPGLAQRAGAVRDLRTFGRPGRHGQFVV